MAKTSTASQMMNERQAAEMMGFTVSKLRADRLKGIGCPYYRIRRAVRYRLADVEAFLAEYRIEPERVVR